MGGWRKGGSEALARDDDDDEKSPAHAKNKQQK